MGPASISIRTRAIVVLATFLLTVGAVVWVYGVGAVSLMLTLLAVLVFGLLGLIATADPDARDDGDVWDAIPSWQYGGRHVESGGLTRGEQERALEEIQEQAENGRDE